MAIDLSALLDEGVILPNARAATRKQVITDLAEALSGVIGVEVRRIVDAVMEREQLGSTGVGDGVAIPHARLKGLAAPVGGFMRLESGVDFQAIDERPCDLIFMLLAPDSAGADHLRALAQVARAFRQPAVRDQLRQAGTEQAVRTVLCRAANNAAA